jgi:hypothetical protein
MRWLTLLLIGCTSSQPPAPPDVAHPWRAARKTVLLKSGDASCGAVAIAPNLLATAEHCMREDWALYATISDPGSWQSGTILYRDDVADLAIVNTSTPLREWATLAEASPGASVYSVHHGGGTMWRTETGVIEDEPRIRAAQWLKTSVWITFGASGCGLWNSRNELAGITSWFDGNDSYFVPAFEIERVIR